MGARERAKDEAPAPRRRRGCRIGLGARAVGLAAALLLAVPAALGPWLADRRALEAHKGRRLAEAPAAADWTAEPLAAATGLAAYLSDRIAGSVAATEALGRLRFHILGDSASEIVLREGEMLFNGAWNAGRTLPHVILRRACGEADDGRPWRDELVANSLALHDALSAPGRRVSFLLVPGKPVLYPDRLPAAVAPELRAACAAAHRPGRALDGWAEALRARGIVARYPVERLAARRGEAHFYPPENFHSEGLAAHLAAWDLLAALRPDAGFEPGAVPTRPAQVTSDLAGFLGFPLRITIRRPDYGPARPRRSTEAETALGRVALPEVPAARWLRVWENRAEGAEGTVLTVSNSFGFYVPQHLAPGYARVVAVVGNVLDIEDLGRVYARLLPEVAPDEIVFITNDAYAVRFSFSRFAGGLAAAGLAPAP